MLMALLIVQVAEGSRLAWFNASCLVWLLHACFSADFSLVAGNSRRMSNMQLSIGGPLDDICFKMSLALSSFATMSCTGKCCCVKHLR